MKSKFVGWFYIFLSIVYFYDFIISIFNIFISGSMLWVFKALGYIAVGLLFGYVGFGLKSHKQWAWYGGLTLIGLITVANYVVPSYMAFDHYKLYLLFQVWVSIILATLLILDKKVFFAKTKKKK